MAGGAVLPYLTSVVILKVDILLISNLEMNFKIETALESWGCWCPSGSEARSAVDIKIKRVSEPGH
jgi:hypothetical protein